MAQSNVFLILHNEKDLLILFSKSFCCGVNMKKVRDFFNSAATLSIAIVIVKVLGALYKVPLSYMVGEVGLGYFNIAYSVFSFFFLPSYFNHGSLFY